MIELYLIDDNLFIRKAMKQFVEQEPDFKVAGEADNAEDALETLKTLRPGVILVDISLGGDERGIQLIKEIRALGQTCPIITVSLHEEALYADRVLDAGAQGYLMKQEASENIIQAIRNVHAGNTFFQHR